jgi:hypothetical protein
LRGQDGGDEQLEWIFKVEFGEWIRVLLGEFGDNTSDVRTLICFGSFHTEVAVDVH